MKKILFVCHGNICRSPMAEFVLKRYVRRAGLEDWIEVASAATSDEELGNSVYPLARQELAKHGIGCPGKTARQVTPDDYGNYDMIVAMERQNINNLLMVFDGDPEGKLSLLLDHVPASDEGNHGRDVVDPWYTRKFNVAWDDIDLGCKHLFDELQPGAEAEKQAAMDNEIPTE